ncbi:hypothetical protein H4Q26_007234 [Puccinia striiformis f. sp. tritici PST-130]|nr:hypothetical protein H4Q26_007234 [Puccinia striiformis f. sp. tritici PST-130]
MYPSLDPATSPNSITSHLAALSQIASVAHDASNDPSNTTVFVGGLPACISEGTLKTFFPKLWRNHIRQDTPNKGCGLSSTSARRRSTGYAQNARFSYPWKVSYPAELGPISGR